MNMKTFWPTVLCRLSFDLSEMQLGHLPASTVDQWQAIAQARRSPHLQPNILHSPQDTVHSRKNKSRKIPVCKESERRRRKQRLVCRGRALLLLRLGRTASCGVAWRPANSYHLVALRRPAGLALNLHWANNPCLRSAASGAWRARSGSGGRPAREVRSPWLRCLRCVLHRLRLRMWLLPLLCDVLLFRIYI
jgi:hypothetical protein